MIHIGSSTSIFSLLFKTKGILFRIIFSESIQQGEEWIQEEVSVSSAY